MNALEKQKSGEIVVGLDIGTTKICVLVARKAGKGKVEILGKGQVPSRGVERGEVVNIKYTAEDIKEAVILAEKQSGYKIVDVFVGIAGAHIKCNVMRMNTQINRSHEKRLIEESDVERLKSQAKNIATNPGEEIINYQIQEFFVDGKKPLNNQPVGMRGNQLEANLHIIVGNTNPTKNIEMAVEMAGLNLLDMDLEPLASSASVLTEEQIKEGVCLVDIGGGTTDLAIFSDGIIRHTAIFPYAGNYITSEISRAFKLSERSAGLLKENTQVVSALYNHLDEKPYVSVPNLANQPNVEIQQKKLCRFMYLCLSQIFDLVKSELKASPYGESLNAGIVITGGGAMIPHLKNFVEQHLGIPAQIGSPTTYLTNLKDRTLTESKYATGVGLLLLAGQMNSGNMAYNPKEMVATPIVEAEIAETPPTEAPKAAPKKPKSEKTWLNRLKVNMDLSHVKNKLENFILDDSEVHDFEE